MRVALLLAVCLLLVSATLAKKHHPKHEKKHHHAKESDVFKAEKDELDVLAEDEREEAQLKAAGDEKRNTIPDTKRVEEACKNKKCGAGRMCTLGEDGEAQCTCIEKCAPEYDERRKVCSNHNETWDSDCELYRMRCLCVEEDEQCKHHKYKHAHVDYYGTCKEIPPCTPEEMEDFPRRMREWLFNVMQDLARRDELSEPVLQLEKEAEESMNRKWVNAVIWKFCDLDTHPHDRSVSRHELFPIRAPLLAMEHCIAPFLDSCDSNNDHRISLVEWGRCLGLHENEIIDKCSMIPEHRG